MGKIGHAEVEVDSERVVPLLGRAEWLEKHGPQPPTVKVLVSAPFRQWELAGGQISASGVLGVPDGCTLYAELLREAQVSAMCGGISDGKIELSEPVASRMLKAAIEAEAAASSRLLTTRERSNKVKRKATEYALGSNNPWLQKVVSDGYDVRRAVLDTVIRDFAMEFGEEPLCITGKKAAFILRGSPKDKALEMSARLEKALASFVKPDFVTAEVMKICRTNETQETFITVVPVLFRIEGLSPVFAAWRADSSF